MTKGSQARIIAVMFAVGALALVLVICDDWLRGRTVQVSGTSPPADTDKHAWPARSKKGSVP